MAINWNFNADDYKESGFALIPVDDHRVRIRDAEEKTSSNGNDMIVLTLDVSGYASSLWFYLVFVQSNPQMVNQRLGSIFDSFGITPGDMNLENWKGKVGACRVKHEKYNGETQAKVSYFISKEKQEQMPPWSEAPGKASVTGGGGDFNPITEDDGELPF